MRAGSLDRPLTRSDERGAERAGPPARPAARAQGTGFEPFLLAAGLGLGMWVSLLALLLL